MTKMTYRSVLITGASSGIGRELCIWLARRGVRVFAAARRVKELNALRDAVSAAGGVLEPVVMDVVQVPETIEQIQRLDQSCGGLDLVVANAAIGEMTPARKLQWAAVERTIQVNVMGAAATLCAVLPQMIERGRGHLAGVSSIAATRGLPRMAAYCGSKAFLSVFLEGLRVDLRHTGVKVTSIYPGYVKSEMTAKNKGPMPFLLETADAAERIGKALLRAEAEIVFPWQMGLTASMMRALPNALYDRLLGGRPRRAAGK